MKAVLKAVPKGATIRQLSIDLPGARASRAGDVRIVTQWNIQRDEWVGRVDVEYELPCPA